MELTVLWDEQQQMGLRVLSQAQNSLKSSLPPPKPVAGACPQMPNLSKLIPSLIKPLWSGGFPGNISWDKSLVAAQRVCKVQLHAWSGS